MTIKGLIVNEAENTIKISTENGDLNVPAVKGEDGAWSFNYNGRKAKYRPKTEYVKEASEFVRYSMAFKQGLSESVLGMLNNYKAPEGVPEDQGMLELVSRQIGTLAGDAPAMVAGAVAGGYAGAMVAAPSGETAAPVTVPTMTIMGAFAAPKMMKKMLINSYKNNEAVSAAGLFKDAIVEMPGVLFEGMRGASEGLVLSSSGGAGKIAGKAVESAVVGQSKNAVTRTAARMIPTVFEQTTQAAAMTATSSILDQRMPTKKEFVENAVTGIVMSGIMPGVSSAVRSFKDILDDNIAVKKAKTSKVNAYYDAFVEEDIHPKDLKASASDPNVQQEIGAINRKAPSVLRKKELSPTKALTEYQKVVTDMVDEHRPLKYLGSSKVPPSKDPYLLSQSLGAKVAFKTTEAFSTGRLIDSNNKVFSDKVYDLTKFLDLDEAERTTLNEALIKTRMAEKTAQKLTAEEQFQISGELKPNLEEAKKSAQAMLDTYSPEIVQAVRKINETERLTLDYAEHEGFFTKEEAQRMKDANEYFVPFTDAEPTEMEGASKGFVGRGVAEFSTTKREIKEPLVAAVKRINSVIYRVEKNRLNKAIVNSMAATGNAREIKPLQESKINAETGEVLNDQKRFGLAKYGDRVVQVFDKGEPRYFEVSKDVSQALNAGYDMTEANMLTRFAIATNNVKRANAILNVPFTVSLALYDQFSGIAGVPKYKPVYSLIKGASKIISGDAEYFEAGRLGVFDSSFMEDIKEGAELVFDKKGAKITVKADPTASHLSDKNVLYRAKDIIDYVYTPLGRLMSNMSKASRVENYSLWKEELKLRNPEWSDVDIQYKAAELARKATLDTTRIGRQMRTANRLFMFLNAGIQAPTQMIELANEMGHKQLAYAVAGTVMSTAALWALNREDENYAMLSQQARDKYWFFPVGTDYSMKVPKPPMFKQIANATELSLEAAFNKKTIKLEDVWNAANPIIGPEDGAGNIISSFVAGPLIEVNQGDLGYSYYAGNPIIPRYLEKVDALEQYTANTTSLAIIASKTVAPFHKVSPMKVDHVINGYLGQINFMLDYALKFMPEDYRVNPKADRSTIANNPFTKKFVQRFPDAAFGKAYDLKGYFKDKVTPMVKLPSSGRLKSLASGVQTGYIPKDSEKGKEITSEMKEYQARVLKLSRDKEFVKAYGTLKKFDTLTAKVFNAVHVVSNLPEESLVANKDVYKKYGIPYYGEDTARAKRREIIDGLLRMVASGIDDAEKAKNYIERNYDDNKLNK